MRKKFVCAAAALGFALAASAQCFDPSLGALLARGDDGPLPLPRALGFAFPFAGATWSHVQVNLNGMLWLTHGGAAGEPATGYSDSPAVLVQNLRGVAGQSPRIAPYWKDLVLSSAHDGGVWVDVRADRCVITWRNAVEWGRTAPKTVQCTLAAGGAITFWYSAGFQVESGAAVIGVSPGGGVADPGPLDLAPAAANAAGALVYETFTAGGCDLGDRAVVFTPVGGGFAVRSPACVPARNVAYGAGCGAPLPLLQRVLPAPVLGRTLLFVTERIPAQAPLALLAVSLAAVEPGIELGGLGAPGCLLSVELGAAVFVPLLRPLADQFAAHVPNDPGLIGRAVWSQSAALAPGANALGLVTSNGVRSEFNSY